MRVWPANQARPNDPLVSLPPVTPIVRENPQLEILAVGGTGCCSYYGYDLRVDDIVVTRFAEVVANAGADVSVDEGTTGIALDGSQSSGSPPLAYHWQQLGVNPGDPLEVALSGSDTATPTFQAPQVTQNQTLTFQLTVTDSHNASASDMVNVTVATYSD